MEDISQNPSTRGDNLIPLVFKKYEKGELTQELVTSITNKTAITLNLSCEKGLGLKLKEIVPGKVVIVAGGTGLLPFSDIIDLLFK